MAAPAFASAGSIYTYQSGTTAAIPVPSGVTNTATDIVMVGMYMDTNVTITKPLDFAECQNSPVIGTAGGQAHLLRTFWRRPSAADSGTYTFSWSGSTNALGFALRFTDCLAAGNPFDSLASTAAAVANTNVTTTPAVSGTTLGPNRRLVFFADSFGGGGFGTISGWVEHVDAADGLDAQSKAQAAAGATGSITTTTGSSGSSNAWMGALMPTATSSPGTNINRAPMFRASLY